MTPSQEEQLLSFFRKHVVPMVVKTLDPQLGVDAVRSYFQREFPDLHLVAERDQGGGFLPQG